MEDKSKVTEEEKIKVAVIEGVIDGLKPDHKYKSLIVQELKKYQIAEKHLLNIVQICINCTESVIGAYSIKEEAKTKEKDVLGNTGTEMFGIEGKMTSQLTWSASLPIFDPRKESFEKYLALLEEAFLLDDVDNEGKKMAIVKLKSTEEVRVYIASLPKPITFKVLCERLTAKFNNIANKTNVKVQMKHFKIDLEKLHSNILQFMDLVARSTNRVDNELFEYQVECLMDKLSFNKMLFQRMVDSTHRYENIYDIAADLENYHKNMSKMRISNASFSENLEKKRSSVTCYRCKKIGHIASQCKEENVVKLEDVKPTFNAQSKECKVQVAMQENRAVDSWEPIVYMKDEIREEAMYAAGLQHSEEKIPCGTTLFLPVFIETNERVCETVGFIDTGANVSMVSRVVVDRLKVPVKKNQNILITLANGETRKLQETVKLTVRFKNKGNTDVCEYHVTVGSDILKRVGALIDYQKGMMITTHHPEGIKFIMEKEHVHQKEMKSMNNVEHNDLRKIILEKFPDTFKSIGKCTLSLPPFEYETREVPNFNKYPVDSRHKEQVQAIINEWASCDIIKRSDWPETLLNLHTVPKGNSIRLVIDARPINVLYRSFKYPLPKTKEMLNSFKNAKWMTIIDLTSYFLQLPIEDDDGKYIAFRDTPGQNWQFNRLAFGLKNASAYAQCISEKIAEGTKARSYIDDFIIVSEGEYDEHVNDVILFCNRLKLFNVTANPKKSYFACKSIVALGHVVNDRGIMPNISLIEAWLRYPMFKSYAAIRRFIGAVSWFRDNIPGLAKATRPLCQVMNMKKEFTVTQEMIDAFDDTKRAVADACLNYHARDDREFTLVSDASNSALAAALLQESDVGGYHPVAFFSRSIPIRKKYEFDIKVDDVIHDDEIKGVDEKVERMYLSAFELEIKSISAALEHFRYIIGNQLVVIRTDHKPIVGALKNSNQKWLWKHISHIMQFNTRVEFIPGIRNQLTDAISRAKIRSLEVISSQEDDDFGQKLFSIIESDNDLPGEMSPDEGSGLDSISDSDTDTTIDSNIMLNKVMVKQSQRNSNSVEETINDGQVKKRKRGRPRKMAPTLPKANEMIKKIIPDFVEMDKLNEQLLLQWIHENHGHIGYNKMLHLTKNYVEEGEIQNLSGKIVKILKSCLPCQMKHKAHSREVTETPVVATAPGQLLAMDILGPMNEMKRKNKYVLLTVDVFSRMVTLIELENYQLDEVSTKLWQRVFLQYGYYHTVRCENSGNFKNQQLEDWLANMNIQLDHSSEYHHSGNSLAERYIGAAQQVIFKLCHNNPTQWDMFLKLAEFTLNTSTCSKTGYSAFLLMFAREPVLPLTLLTNKSPYAMIENTPTMAHLTTQLKEIFEDMHELRIDKELNGKTTKAGYIELKMGDAVLRMVPRKPGISTKLQPTYDSKIYHVVSVSIDYVRIKGEGDRKSMVLHRTLIKKINHSTQNKGGSSENGDNPTDIGRGNKS